MTEDMLDELLYFADITFPEKSTIDILSKISIVLLLKRNSEELPGNIDDIVLQMVYGNSRQHPGSEKSPSQILLLKDEEEDETEAMIGIWAPPNALTKATALKLFFPTISTPFKFPEEDPIPPHVAVAYDAFKSRDIMELMLQYPGQVMAYGFFSSDIPGEGQLISKTVEQFENKTIPTTFEEKIVIKLSKNNPDCFMAFSELGPTYMSPNAVVGELECTMFFPPGYNDPEPEKIEIKKKAKKKSKPKAVATVDVGDGEIIAVAESEPSVEGIVEHEDIEMGEADIDEEPEGLTEEDEGEHVEGEVGEDEVDGADKATSPMNEGSNSASA